MLDHLELKTTNLKACLEFYRHVLAPLGYTFEVDGPAKGFGHQGQLDFWLREGAPASLDVHFAFQAQTRAEVEAAYALAPSYGGTADREPALAPHIHPNYYAGYARDPDGRLVEFVCHRVE